MLIFLVVCVLAIAFLVMPEVFEGLWQNAVDNPTLAIPVIVALFVLALWAYRQ